MSETRAVKFRRASAPYNAGEVAGFPALHAQRLVSRGAADFWPPVVVKAVEEVEAPRLPDILDGMDRAQLVVFAREHLGMTDEPPGDVGDDALREAIRGRADAEILKVPAHAAPPAALMAVAPPANKPVKKS